MFSIDLLSNMRGTLSFLIGREKLNGTLMPVAVEGDPEPPKSCIGNVNVGCSSPPSLPVSTSL